MLKKAFCGTKPLFFYIYFNIILLRKRDGKVGGGENEEAVSLAHIDESKTMHSYIASRGQREREEDIYEVVPPKIHILKTTEIIRTWENMENIIDGEDYVD